MPEDEQERDWRVAADTRSDWQDQINKVRYRKLGGGLRSLAFGCGVALLCIAIVIPSALHAVRNANRAAKNADKAAACSSLLLGSVAAQQVDPQARTLGCDTSVADRLITRGKQRDAALQQTQAQVRNDACALLTMLPGSTNSPQVAQFRVDFGCA